MRFLLPGLALLAGACGTGPDTAPQPVAETAEQRAERILTQAPVADGHNDWPHALRTAHGYSGALEADLDEPVTLPAAGASRQGHTSIPWLQQGRVGLQLWSAYVPARQPSADAVEQTFGQIGVIRSMVRRHPDIFVLATTADEAEAAMASGRIASMIALEGAHQVADDIATLRRAYDAGVRAMTLVHSRPTRLFDSATAAPRHGGMAAGGAAVIAEMNRLGMLVDLSHVSDAVMNAVLDVTRAPVIFSHSSARGLTDHVRNVPDDVLRRLADNGGLVMITFVPAFIDQARADWEARRNAQRSRDGGATAMAAWEQANPRPISTLAQVADHIDHAARVAGHDHVGLGGDFDGVPDLPQGLESVATYPALIAELARRGWSDADLKKLTNGNFLRVLRAVESTAAQ